MPGKGKTLVLREDGPGPFVPSLISDHAEVAEVSESSGIIETETPQTIEPPISSLFAGSVTCERMAASKPLESSQNNSNPKLWLPAGLKPYYQEDNIAIFLGDCRDILPHLPKVDLVLTDPPYGINHASSHGASWENTTIANDHSTEARDWMMSWTGLRPMVIFGTWKAPRPHSVRQVLIFDKGPAFGMGDLSFPWKNSFEEIYILGDGFIGSRDEAVLRGHVQVSWESQGREHPNQKPLSLIAYLISKHPANIILDPFMGSGTTLRACKDLGRQCIGIEIEEKYCEIAARRLGQEVLPL